jgi:DNA repair protein RadA/Sms
MFICESCNYQSLKWFSQCPDCRNYNTVRERNDDSIVNTQRWLINSSDKKPIPLSEVKRVNVERIITDIPELDRVFGGGIVPGSIILIGGDPGIGKSTLLLQTAFNVSRKSVVLYASGEETESQIQMRGGRLECISKNIYILSESNLTKIVKHIDTVKPSLIIIDSIQTLYSDNNPATMGSISQVKEVTSQLLHIAKNKNIPIVLIGHITKDGSIAGPKVLEHMVDAVLYFEEENSKNSYRILRANKNRFGRANEIGIFEMTPKGLQSVVNPSGLFIEGYDKNGGSAGSAISINLEGSRPMFIGIQSLILRTNDGNGSKVLSGVSLKRVSMLMSLLEGCIGENMDIKNIYINVLGGIKAEEPTSDLPVLCSLMSSFTKKSIDSRTVIVGEVGLAGEIRSIPQIDVRLMEASRMGFNKAVVPMLNKSYRNGMELIEVNNIEKVFEYFDFI